ncbi:Hsp70 protein-domain-containing protein, partial [Russula aff. rugulosa BPL654]
MQVMGTGTDSSTRGTPAPNEDLSPLEPLMRQATTYSCVGVWQTIVLKIIANNQVNRTTPSYASSSESECLIGDATKNQVAMNPHNIVFDASRLIGRKFDDQDSR